MELLNITELFLSIQGETRFTGLPTVFLRLSGCNLRCTWCDTTYSFAKGQSCSLEELQKKIMAYQTRHVCITGGEPLLQKNIYPLMTRLCDANHILSLETSGSLDISQVDERVACIVDVKCPGSGHEKDNYWPNLERLGQKDEVKFVILDRTDYEYTKAICERYNLYERVGAVLLSPVHGKLQPQQLVEWFLADHLAVRLNLQTHKYVWPPETRGV